jgi:hypothetical protein
MAAAASAGALYLWQQRVPRPAVDMVVLATDMKPEDMFAMLHLRMRGVKPSAILVGEGDVDLKVWRARRYAHLLRWTHTHVVAGMPSSSPTCPEEGRDLGIPPVWYADTAAEAMTPDEFGSWTSTLTKLVDRADAKPSKLFPSPTLMFFKPPRELKSALIEQPKEATALFNRVKLIVSGVSGLAEVGWDVSLPWLNPDTTPFHRVRVFENLKEVQFSYDPARFPPDHHYTTNLTVANMANPHGSAGPPHRALPDEDSPLALFCVCIQDTADWWDVHTLSQPSPSGWSTEDLKRAHKIALIQANAGRQFAFTSPAVAALVTKRESVSTVSSAWLPGGAAFPEFVWGKFTNDPKVGLYQHFDDDELKWELSDAFRAVFRIGAEGPSA